MANPNATKRKPPVTIENARLLFRNFEGRKTQFNAQGERNFNVIIPAEDYEKMKADGWNVRTKEPRPEYPDDEPMYLLAVKVNYSENTRPPRVVLIAGDDRQELDEHTIAMLDRVQIEKCDLMINASYYDVNGRQGYKAYLRSIYVTIVQDELEKKYGSFATPASGNTYTDDSDF